MENVVLSVVFPFEFDVEEIFEIFDFPPRGKRAGWILGIESERNSFIGNADRRFF